MKIKTLFAPLLLCALTPVALLPLNALAQTTTNNPGVPIFGAGGTASGLQFVFVNGLGNIASPPNFFTQNAFPIVTSAGATNGNGSRVAFLADITNGVAGTAPTNQFGQTWDTTTSIVGPQNTNRNSWVPQTIYAQFQTGSASAFYDLPPNADIVNAIQQNPWIGVLTTDSRTSTNSSVAYQYQTNDDQLVTIANYFNTSGIAAQLAAAGTAPNIWVDQNWYAPHLTNGLLVPISKFSGGLSNVMYQVHTNGATATFHVYHTTQMPNQTNGDTEIDFAQQSVAFYGYPSQSNTLTTNNNWFPLMNPLNCRSFVDWAYTNGIDGIFSADTTPGGRGYDYQRASALYDAIMYPNLGARNVGRDRWDLAYPSAKHPIWLDMFLDQPHLASLRECDVWTPDQDAGSTGSEPGLGQVMSYLEWYYNTVPLTNAPANSAMPFFSANDFTQGVTAWTAQSYTNFYTFLGITHGCAAMAWTREAGAWNTLQNGIVTNSGFLSVWLDKPRYMPLRAYDNGTNSVWFNRVSNGDFLLAAENRGPSATNLTIDLGQAGFIPTNGAFYDVIPVFGGIYGGGTVSNLVVTNLASGQSLFWRLRKQQQWNEVPLSTLSLQSSGEVQNLNSLSPVLQLSGTIQYAASTEMDAGINIPYGNGFSNVVFQALYDSGNVNTWSNNYYTRWADTSLHTSEQQINFSNHIAASGILSISWTNHWTNDNYPRYVLFSNMGLTNAANAIQLDKVRWRWVPQ